MFKIRSNKPTPGKVSNDLLCQAVREKRVLLCRYRSEDMRKIQPHCHGHSHTGHEVLSAFQIEQGDGNWKMFAVEDLSDVRFADETFNVHTEFNPHNPGMSQVHCCVQ